ncbi:hypothetical protein SLS62_009494 [Diatrype stigma]|uniref:F-box domain-containing protein n=1 Tax=Diatrype stigma TaxID=117547 RepID=A0AAN9UDG2_9PEZI
MYDEPPMSSSSSYFQDAVLEKTVYHETSPRPTTAISSNRNRSVSTSLPWRRRPKSLAIADALAAADADGEIAPNELGESAIDESPQHSPNDANRQGHSLKGKLRRASLVFMKGIVRGDRRSSEPATDIYDVRPATSHSAWNKLRHATPFRHTKYGSRAGLETIYSPVASNFTEVPVPGNRFEPPIIPHHTGAAAKAAVAMQNEYLVFAKQQHDWLSADGPHNDCESGIGITLTQSESESELTTGPSSSVARIDFISQLPVELAIQVFAHLDASHLATASRVSKLWCEVIKDQHVWRQSFLREKAATYATTLPVQPGTGFGVPSIRSGNDWKKIYRARQELDQRWKIGRRARAVYLNGHLDSIYCLQFDENKIITGSRDKTIRIWDMHTLQCRLVIGPPEVVNETSILFDPNGKPLHFASLPDNERMNPSVPVTVSFPTHHKASILCLQYDDDILVTGSSDSTCIVYSVQSGYRPVRRLQNHTAAVLDLAFDDKHIVTCSKDISICVWDRETGSLLKQLRGHTGPVNAVQLRGNTIVSCSGDFSVKMWNIDSGKTIREFLGHTKGLACSQFSEDGRYIASAGSDKVVRIWDAHTGECIREMQAHESLVRSLHIDSVNGRLISGSYDTDIKVFDMETGEQLLSFPRWHASWVLSAKSDYRRIVSTGQDPKILIMDFGADVPDIRMLESARKHNSTYEGGFI